MKTRELINLGVPKSIVREVAKTAGQLLSNGMPKEELRNLVKDIFANPEAYREDATWSRIVSQYKPEESFVPREEKAPYQVWGSEIDDNTFAQMSAASELPIAHRGALMPDAHLGYGLPIGGVLATKNAVIPYAVGMDIACRMKLSVFDAKPAMLKGKNHELQTALEEETAFGQGAGFTGAKRRVHDVLDEDWSITPEISRMKDIAWKQLGSSGSGNHFVEFGVVKIPEDTKDWPAGEYLALLSHSGSRGPGSKIASYYSKLAMEKHPGLPKHLKHLAWLDMDSADGQEYWAAMNLMGNYAAANHEMIHQKIAKHLKLDVLLNIENHHNFAWLEEHDGKDVIVHRKGATPAGEGVLGIIPGTMASPAYIVEGKGNAASLNSASHGAGRRLSRKAAQNSTTWHAVKKELEASGVQLLSAGLDESPHAYKNIHAVMAEQSDLVTPLAQFQPKMVKMAPEENRRKRY